MKKLILSCLVIVSLGLLAGCGNSSDSSSQQQQTPAPSNAPPPSATHTNN